MSEYKILIFASLIIEMWGKNIYEFISLEIITINTHIYIYSESRQCEIFKYMYFILLRHQILIANLVFQII